MAAQGNLFSATVFSSSFFAPAPSSSCDVGFTRLTIAVLLLALTKCARPARRGRTPRFAIRTHNAPHDACAPLRSGTNLYVKEHALTQADARWTNSLRDNTFKSTQQQHAFGARSEEHERHHHLALGGCPEAAGKQPTSCRQLQVSSRSAGA